MGKRAVFFCAACLLFMLCAGCSSSEITPGQQEAASVQEEAETEKTDIGQGESAGAKGTRAWEAKVLEPEAPGTESYATDVISLDASHTSEGYVMLSYNGDNEKVKVQIEAPGEIKYTYVVAEYGNYMAYPLSYGSGVYRITVYEAASAEENLYAVAMKQELTVELADEWRAFLYPNCYVNFDSSSACVKKGEELARGCDTDLDVVEAVYRYVTKNIVYDYEKAETVQPGYAPCPDDTLASGTGICFDYAALMSAMLRSQQIPTRLEVGYVGELYHAWISCYIEDVGWVDKVIEFDGKSWTMMDPTMAASGGSKEVIRLEKESGYIVKYVY